MKFPSLSASDERLYKLSLPSEQLRECQNLYERNGCLQTRPGLQKTAAGLPPMDPVESVYRSLHFTEVTVIVEGTLRRLAYDMVWDTMSHLRIRTFFFDESGNILSGGDISFNRVSQEVFYVPETVNFFAGGPTGGGGIYAFVHAVSNGQNSWYTAYEIDEDMDTWEAISSDEFYVPTVYMNGRGNGYEDAVGADTAYAPTPRSPESFNLLNGRFMAYFSTDSISSEFQLPFGGLSNESISCRLYTNPSTYHEWTIPPDSDVGTLMYTGVVVTLHCNRQSGRFWFTTPSGSNYVPAFTRSYRGNNLRIEAGRTIADGVACVYGASCVETVGEHVYAAASPQYKGRICMARRSQPLYFPQDCITQAGDDLSPVTAIRSLNGAVLAFKTDEVFRVDVTIGRFRTVDPSLAGAGTLYHEVDIAKCRPVLSATGCRRPETLRRVNDRLIWTEPNGAVYGLSSATLGGTRKVKPLISIKEREALAEQLTGIETVTAAATEHDYLLCAGNRAWLFDGEHWYSWVFPSDVAIVAADGSEEIFRVHCQVSGLPFKAYSALLCGETDIYIADENGTYPTREKAVEYRFCTEPLDFGRPDRRKAVDAIFLSGSATAPFRIDCGRSVLVEAVPHDVPCTYRVRPQAYGNPFVSVTVYGSGSASFRDLGFRYRYLSEVGLEC